MGRRPEYAITQEGRRVRTREHRCTWHGKHNQSKALVFMVLYHCWSEKLYPDGLCLPELAALSSVPALTLRSALPDWIRWQYVRRKAKEYHQQPVFAYFIDARGRHFVEKRIPPGKIEELKVIINQAVANRRLNREAC
jgi:hypothetical protein